MDSLRNDLLFKMLLRTRPYEKNPARGEGLFEQYLQRVTGIMPEIKRRLESHKLAALLNTGHLTSWKSCCAGLRRLCVPVDGVGFSNPTHQQAATGGCGRRVLPCGCTMREPGHLRKLEADGAETWLAPATEFFSYANFIGKGALRRPTCATAGLRR